MKAQGPVKPGAAGEPVKAGAAGEPVKAGAACKAGPACVGNAAAGSAMVEAYRQLGLAAGGCLRPGGLALTAQGLERCGFAPGGRIVDVGCGQGASLGLLASLGFAPLGVELCPAMAAMAAEAGRAATGATAAGQVVRGDFLCLPCKAGSADGLLCECVLSLASDKRRFVAECARVLKPGGRMLLSDLTLPERGEGDSLDVASGMMPPAAKGFHPLDPHQGDGKGASPLVRQHPSRSTVRVQQPRLQHPGPRNMCSKGALTRAGYADLLREGGFTLCLVEDHSRAVRELAARLVWEYGAERARALWQCGGQAGVSPGYVLIIAEKTG